MKICLSIVILGLILVTSPISVNAEDYSRYTIQSHKLPTVYEGSRVRQTSAYRYSPSNSSLYNAPRLYEPHVKYHQSRNRTTYPRIYSHQDLYNTRYAPSRYQSDIYRQYYTRSSNYYRYRPYYTWPESVERYRPEYTYAPSHFRYYHPNSYFLRPPMFAPFPAYGFGYGRVLPYGYYGTARYFGAAPVGIGYRYYGGFRGPAFYGMYRF